MEQRSLDLTDDTSHQYFQNLPLNQQREVIDLMAKTHHDCFSVNTGRNL